MLGEFWYADAEDAPLTLAQVRDRDPGLHDEVAALVASDGRAVRRLVRIADAAVEVVRDEPLDLSDDAHVRFLEAQLRAGLLGEDAFLLAFPARALAPAQKRLADTEDLRPVVRGISCSAGCGTGVLRSGDYDGDEPFVVAVDRVEARHTGLLRDPRCAGLVAVRGSQADHFALLARESGLGYLAVPDAMIERQGLRVADTLVAFGSTVTVDFTEGCLYVGSARIAPAEDDAGRARARSLLARRPRPVVLTVSVDGPDVLQEGLPAGAVGIGLLRVEHLIRLAGLDAEVGRLLESPGSAPEFVEALSQPLAQVLRAAGGRPVAVRLFDLPVPALPGRYADATDPSLGLRGVRQGVRWPHAYRAQVLAVSRAAETVQAYGGTVAPLRVLVPMVCVPAELDLVRSWIETEADDIRLGAMLETPAALTQIEDIAGACEFALFGTNDLTSLTLGIGRSDSVSVLEGHLQRGLFPDDPFESLHPAVLRLVREAAERARAAEPSIELGLCGRHARDPGALDLALTGIIDHLCVEPGDVDTVSLAALQRAAT